MNVLPGLKYTQEHEWLKIEGKNGQVGISDYAQHQLGDIVFVELPAAGKSLKKGDVLATVESVKAVSEVYMPVTGVVVKTNTALESSPEKINNDPYHAGWIAEIEITNASDTNELLDEKSYSKFLEEAK